MLHVNTPYPQEYLNCYVGNKFAAVFNMMSIKGNSYQEKRHKSATCYSSYRFKYLHINNKCVTNTMLLHDQSGYNRIITNYTKAVQTVSRRKVLPSVRLSGELQKYLVPHDALRTAIRHNTDEISVLIASAYFVRCVLCERKITTVGNELEGHQTVRLSWFVCLCTYMRSLQFLHQSATS